MPKITLQLKAEELKKRLQIRDGIDGTNGIDGKDGSPDTPQAIRDKLEGLPEGEKLSIQAIQDLPKLLEDLKRVASAPRTNASLISKRIRFVDDETPTNSGDNLNFTIVRAPEAGSLKLYRGGGRQKIT